MDTNYRVRLAGPEDIGDLMILYRLHLNTANPAIPVDERVLSHWRSILDNPLLNYIVAEVDGSVVATCNLTVVPNLTYDLHPYGLIENVVTHEDFRRQGIGKAVVQMALDIAWKSGCYKQDFRFILFDCVTVRMGRPTGIGIPSGRPLHRGFVAHHDY